MRQPATVPGAGGMIKDMADDEAIQATNDDASECKRYAVQLGYWCDPFISLFVKQTARKAPEINRGYYARVKGIELFVDKFLKVSVGRYASGPSPPVSFGFSALWSPPFPRFHSHAFVPFREDVRLAERKRRDTGKSRSSLSAPSAPSASLPASRRDAC